MRVLVLGGTGLVGKNLEDYVKINSDDRTWYFASSKDADLTIYEDVIALFSRFYPTHVINLAAYVGGLYKNMEEGVEFFTKNMLINMNVMKACFQTKVVKLISMLSTCIFPDKVTYPITEEYLHDGAPHWSNEGYAYSKRMVDVLSRAYNKQHKTKYICVIPGNLYGKYDNFNLNDSHVLPALIHKCYIANKTSNNLIVNGSGRPLRQFTYAVDLAKLLVWALDNYEDNQSIILSSSEEHSISSVCDIIRKCMKYTGEVIYDTSKEDGQYKKTVSNEKLQKLIDFKFTSIEKGISETIEWFNENYTKDIRK